jgi:23S rRNA (uracil1939-C5)-methyltransferase
VTRPDATEDAIVVDVTALSHGRDGVARHEGKVVFVPGVAPGDRARVRIVEPHASYARAELLEIETPGTARREPPCPWVGDCGGCPWQQVAYPAQLEAKAHNVRETLARLGGVVPARLLPIVAAPAEWGYRHRIRLHVEPGGRLGYRAARSHRLVEVDACAVADPRLAALLAPVRRTLATVATRLESLELIVDDGGHVVLSAGASGAFHPRDTGPWRRLLAETPAIAGVMIRGRGWRRRFGEVHVRVRPEANGPAIAQTAGTFSQVNPAANRLLVEAVVALARPAARILDLHCGAGNLSLPLARAGSRVTGVDRDRTAIADARASAAAAGLADRTEFTAADAVATLRQDGARDADLVLLDPPRTGAREVAAELARVRVPRVLYVSCDVATLARDARALVAGGYAVDRVQPIDLFPQTEHVETVLEAVLTDP